MIHDHLMMGKRAPRINPDTPHLTKFLRHYLPRYPTYCDYSGGKKDWPIYANDRIGLCTLAAALRLDTVWMMNTAGMAWPFTEDDAIDAYERVTALEGAPFNPRTGANDNGAVEDDVLEMWRKEGIGGRQILGWTDLEPTDIDLMKFAISVFGGVYIGLRLPQSAKQQIERGGVWSVASRFDPAGQPGSWGCHALMLCKYDQNLFWGPPWTQMQPMTTNFVAHYCDEVHVPVSEDWISFNTGISPSHFNMEELLKTLHDIGPVH